MQIVLKIKKNKKFLDLQVLLYLFFIWRKFKINNNYLLWSYNDTLIYSINYTIKEIKKASDKKWYNGFVLIFF